MPEVFSWNKTLCGAHSLQIYWKVSFFKRLKTTIFRFSSVVYYTYSLALIAVTAVLSIAVKRMSTVSKPLPHRITWFLQSGYLVYLGIEINVRTSNDVCTTPSILDVLYCRGWPDNYWNNIIINDAFVVAGFACRLSHALRIRRDDHADDWLERET